MAENVKQNDAKENNGFSMENIVTTALQIPGIKVNRNQLLADYFKNQNDASIEDVLTKGPIEAGCSKETLSKIADKVILKEQHCLQWPRLLPVFRVDLQWLLQYPLICSNFLVSHLD